MHVTGIAINETNENESKNAIIKLCSLDIDDSKYETYTTLHHIDLLSKSLELLISWAYTTLKLYSELYKQQ